MEFVSPEAAADAIEAKQKGHLRHRYIECVPLPHSPCEKYINCILPQFCLVYSTLAFPDLAESAIYTLYTLHVRVALAAGGPLASVA